MIQCDPQMFYAVVGGTLRSIRLRLRLGNETSHPGCCREGRGGGVRSGREGWGTEGEVEVPCVPENAKNRGRLDLDFRSHFTPTHQE